ncbi:hypothetical protein QMK47_17975 [Pseudomonas sp. P9_35]|jgi:hypothetical protein|uniref:hypothetical protein n=1 Tax=unclassified Pseudomonas TaxID=196821 RepID=UPI002A368C83|nr:MULTISPECIES: hypothetical protein [unclassified Pseudomonas]WPN61432.1 hypothetical protein QMK48_17075 [Pseudomonas sp. P9_32]WPN67187.1 hypothetical protein QMK47_17975 [Pseudomonas sp. P9_35]
MKQNVRTQRLDKLHKLVTAYTAEAHEEKLLPADHPALAWFTPFKYLNPVSWALAPNKIPYVAATALVDSYSCLPRRPDMAFTYLWTATNSCYNDLYMKSSAHAESLGDSKAIEKSLIEINKIMQSQIALPTASSQGPDFSTPQEIILDFAHRLPDKTLHFVASYILKGMAIEKHNEFVIKKANKTGKKADTIRKIHISSSYKSFKTKFKAMFNHFYWTYGEAYSALCTITENPDKTDVSFGIVENEKSRKITHALGKEIKTILIKIPAIDQFDDLGKPTVKTPALYSDTQRLEFLVFCLLYATRNNNAHGNVASRVGSIFSDSQSIVAATWIFLFGYFYLSLILLCLGSIEPDDLHIHSLNASLLDKK